MDYIIAGLTAALFVYLVYALLLPERSKERSNR